MDNLDFLSQAAAESGSASGAKVAKNVKEAVSRFKSFNLSQQKQALERSKSLFVRSLPEHDPELQRAIAEAPLDQEDDEGVRKGAALNTLLEKIARRVEDRDERGHKSERTVSLSKSASGGLIPCPSLGAHKSHLGCHSLSSEDNAVFPPTLAAAAASPFNKVLPLPALLGEETPSSPHSALKPDPRAGTTLSRQGTVRRVHSRGPEPRSGGTSQDGSLQSNRSIGRGCVPEDLTPLPRCPGLSADHLSPQPHSPTPTLKRTKSVVRVASFRHGPPTPQEAPTRRICGVDDSGLDAALQSALAAMSPAVMLRSPASRAAPTDAADAAPHSPMPLAGAPLAGFGESVPGFAMRPRPMCGRRAV